MNLYQNNIGLNNKNQQKNVFKDYNLQIFNLKKQVFQNNFDNNLKNCQIKRSFGYGFYFKIYF